MRMRTRTVLLFAMAGLALPASAGFLENLVKKTTESVKKTVEEAVNEKVDEEVDKVLETDEGKVNVPSTEDPENPAEASPEDQGTAAAMEAAGVANSTKPTTVRALALAVVKVAPEIFDIRPDYDIKELLLQIFPEEKDIRGNEFYWHGNKDHLIAKAKELATNAPVTFEVAPWIDNSPDYGYSFQKTQYFQPMFGKYDFERRAFPVHPAKLEVPWLAGYSKSNVGVYQFVGIEEPSEDQWVEVPIDKAEKLTNSQPGTFKLHSHFVFTIAGVTGLSNIEEHPNYQTYKKYLDMGGAQADATFQKLKPYFDIKIKDNKIDLYIATKPVYAAEELIDKSDLELFTTLDLSPKG